MKKLVDRFLSWPIPDTVCSDSCVTDHAYPHQRVGTNLLTASEALEMLAYVLREDEFHALQFDVCLSGDCPHYTQDECDAHLLVAIRSAYARKEAPSVPKKC